jgi:hypothetical protein
MSFYTFGPDDIINTHILAYPSYNVSLNGDQMTGSVYLEKQFLTSSLFARRWQGWSDKEGGFVEADGPFDNPLRQSVAITLHDRRIDSHLRQQVLHAVAAEPLASAFADAAAALLVHFSHDDAVPVVGAYRLVNLNLDVSPHVIERRQNLLFQQHNQIKNKN